MSENELKYDINVIPVWKENNFGQGVRIMIIDDGVETTHDDLIDNYVSVCSLRYRAIVRRYRLELVFLKCRRNWKRES